MGYEEGGGKSREGLLCMHTDSHSKAAQGQTQESHRAMFLMGWSAENTPGTRR